jgi:hypothetical protein
MPSVALQYTNAGSIYVGEEFASSDSYAQETTKDEK